jgi:hypothetical protein
LELLEDLFSLLSVDLTVVTGGGSSSFGGDQGPDNLELVEVSGMVRKGLT